MRGRWRSKDKAFAGTHDLAPRLGRVERELKRTSTETHPEEAQRDSNAAAPPARAIHARDRRGSRQRSLSPQVPTFSGETSIAHNITVVEGRLEQMGVHYGQRSNSPGRSFRSCLTPSPVPPINRSSDRQTSFIRRILDTHGITPDRETWERLMHTFCDEIHILVPFLHPPSLWKLHEEMWRGSLGQESGDDERSGARRVQAAHVLLCVANGRCVETSRYEGDTGPYSAGWSLYSAARDIFGDLLEGFCQCTDQVFVLQTALLMVRPKSLNGFSNSLIDDLDLGCLSLPP